MQKLLCVFKNKSIPTNKGLVMFKGVWYPFSCYCTVKAKTPYHVDQSSQKNTNFNYTTQNVCKLLSQAIDR